MAKLFSLVVVLAALLVVSIDAKSTLKTQTINPASQPSTHIPSFISNSIIAGSVVASSLSLNPTDRLALINSVTSLTGKDTTIAGDLMQISSSQSMLFGGLKDASFHGSFVNFISEDLIALESGASELLVQSRGLLDVAVDTALFKSDGRSSFESGSGPVSIHADELLSVRSSTTLIRGEDGVSIQSSQSTDINGSIRASANIVDIDGTDSLSVTSSAFRMVGGDTTSIESNTLLIQSTKGIELTSTASQLAFDSRKFTALAGTQIDIGAIDDVVVQGGAINVAADVYASSSRSIRINGGLQVTAPKFTITAETVGIQSTNQISITSAPSVTIGTAATQSLAVSTGKVVIQSTSGTQLSGTTRIDVNSQNDFVASTTASGPISITGTNSVTFAGGLLSITTSNTVGSLFNATNDITAFSTGVATFNSATTSFQPKTTGTSSLSFKGGVTNIPSASQILVGAATSVTGDSVLVSSSGILSIKADSTRFTSPDERGSTVLQATSGVISLASTKAASLTSDNQNILLAATNAITASANSLTFNGGEIHSSVGGTGALSVQASTSLKLTSTIDTVMQAAVSTLTTKNAAKDTTLTVGGEFGQYAGSNLDFIASGITMNVATQARFLATNVISTTSDNGAITITESGNIYTTSGPKNDIVLTTTLDSTFISADLAVQSNRFTHSSASLSLTAGSVAVSTKLDRDLSLNTNKDLTFRSSNATFTTVAGEDIVWKNAATGLLSVRGPKGVSLSGAQNVDIVSANDLVFNTGSMDVRALGDVTFSSRSSDDVFHSDGPIVFTHTRGFQVNSGKALSVESVNTTFTASDRLTMTATQLGSTTATFDSDTITTTVGRFTQHDGTVNIKASSVLLQANDEVLVASRTMHTVTSPTNITMVALRNSSFPTLSLGTVTQEANNLVVTATEAVKHLSMRIKADALSFTSSDGDDIKVASAWNVLLQSNNKQPITFTGLGDRFVQAAQVDITARGSFPNGESIVIEATKPEADVVLTSKAGYVTLRATDGIHFKSLATGDRTANAYLSANDDIFVSTKAKDNGGGVNIQSYGVTHDPVFGDDSGISLHSESVGDVMLKSEKQHVIVHARTEASIESFEGSVRFEAAKDVTMTSGKNVYVAAENDAVSFTAPYGPVSITAGNDVDLQASRRATVVAEAVLSIRTTQPITDPDNVAIEFSADSGNVHVSGKGSRSLINLTSVKNTTIDSGIEMSFTAITATTITAQNGELAFNAETGITTNVTDGETTIRANGGVFIESGLNSDVTLRSGRDVVFHANGGSLNISSLDGVALRSASDNILLQTKSATGDINVLGSGVMFQSDGTDNTVGGTGIDGVFLKAQNVDFGARATQVWEIEGTLAVGTTRSQPRVLIETGGDGIDNGFAVTSVGNAVFNTDNTFQVRSADRTRFLASTGGFSADAVRNVVIESLGTSSVGKNVSFTTPGELSLHGSTAANIEGVEGATMISNGVLRLVSFGSDATANMIKFTSANGVSIDVNRTIDVQALEWNHYTQSLNAEATGDVVLRTTRGGSGDVRIDARDRLTFESDLALTARTTGAASTLTVQTSSANSPITFSVDDSRAVLAIAAADVLSSTADTSVTISGQYGVDITAFDNSVSSSAYGKNGVVSFSSFGAFDTHAAGEVRIGGARGVAVSNVGGAKDIELFSSGEMAFSSRQSAALNANGGDFVASSARHLSLSNIPERLGSVLVTSALRADILTHRDALLQSGDDWTFRANTWMRLIDENAGIAFRSTLPAAVVSVQSTAGGIELASATGTLIEADQVRFTASNNVELSAVSDISVITTKYHGGVLIASDNVLATDSASSLAMKFGTTLAVSATGSRTAEGVVDFQTLTGNLVMKFGGALTASAQAADLRTSAANGVSVTSVADSVLVSSDGNVAGYGIRARVTDGVNGVLSATGSSVAVTSTRSDVSFSAGDFTGPGGRLSFNARGSIGITTTPTASRLGVGFSALSNAPFGDIVLKGTDSIAGSVSITGAQYVSIDGAQGVVLAVPEFVDDLDKITFFVKADATGVAGNTDSRIELYATGGQYNERNGRFDGIIVRTLQESSLYFEGSELEFFADNSAAVASNRLTIAAAVDLYTSATASAQFSARSALTLAAASTNLQAFDSLTILSQGSVTFTATNTIQLRENPAVTLPNPQVRSEEPILFRAGRAVRFETAGVRIVTKRLRAIDVTSDSILRIPYIFPRNAAGALSNAVTGQPCSTDFGTPGNVPVNQWLGGPGSLFWSPAQNRLCYCRPTGLGGAGTVACYA